MRAEDLFCRFTFHEVIWNAQLYLIFTVTYIKNNYLMEQKLAIVNLKMCPQNTHPPLSHSLDHRIWRLHRLKAVWNMHTHNHKIKKYYDILIEKSYTTSFWENSCFDNIEDYIKLEEYKFCHIFHISFRVNSTVRITGSHICNQAARISVALCGPPKRLVLLLSAEWSFISKNADQNTF